MNRESEIAQNLASVEAQIGDAVVAAGRKRSEITLVVVTKNFPVSDMKILYELGIRDFGENREQEASAKVEHFASATDRDYSDIRWHFQGQLQRNKLPSIGSWAHLVHSVDDQKYLKGLSDSANKNGRSLQCLIQISLDREFRVGRGGIDLIGAQELLSYVEAEQGAGLLSGISITGLMGVAPLGEEPDVAFRELQRVFAQVKEQFPALEKISAGMSGDFLPAISCGATHLRIGSSILGSR